MIGLHTLLCLVAGPSGSIFNGKWSKGGETKPWAWIAMRILLLLLSLLSGTDVVIVQHHPKEIGLGLGSSTGIRDAVSIPSIGLYC